GIGNGEIERLGRKDQPLGVLAQLEHLTAIGALPLEYAAGIVQPVGEDVELGILPGDHLPIVPDPSLSLIHWHGGHFNLPIIRFVSSGTSSRCTLPYNAPISRHLANHSGSVISR